MELVEKSASIEENVTDDGPEIAKIVDDEDVDFNPLFDNLSILEKWMLSNRLKDINADKKVFFDQYGVRRFTESWLPAFPLKQCIDKRHNDIGIFPMQSGCVQVSLQLGTESTDAVKKSKKQNISKENNGSTDAYNSFPIKMNFIKNWKMLWKFYAEDKSDEIFQSNILFGMLISLFIHRRTAQLVIFLAFYNTVVTVAMYEHYKVEFPAQYLKIYLYTFNFAYMYFYLVIYVLFKGSTSDIFFEEQPEMMKKEVEVKPDTSKANFLVAHSVENMRTLTWTNAAIGSFKTVCKTLKDIFKRGKNQSNDHVRGPCLSIVEDISYHQLMNICMKFMIDHCEKDLRKSIKQKSKTKYYNLVMLGIAIIIPVTTILEIIQFQFAWIQIIIQPGCDYSDCVGAKLVFSLQLGYFTQMLFTYICYSAIYLGLLSLSYGSEIAAGMTYSWIKRFGSLRLVDIDELSADISDVSKNQCNESSDDCEENKTAIEAYERRMTATTERIRRRGSGITEHDGSALNTFDQTFSSTNPLHQNSQTATENSHTNQRDQDNSQKNALKNDGLSDQPSSTAKQTEQRARAFLKAPHLVPFINRDAYEHYFFIAEFMSRVSVIWSPVLLGLIFLCIYLFSSYGILIAIGLQKNYFKNHLIFFISAIIYMLFRLIALAIFPVMCIASANSYVNTLYSIFDSSAPDDFSLLGGKEVWMQFLTTVPAVWTFFGMWVTVERLNNCFTTAVGTIATCLGSYYFSLSDDR